MKKSKTDSLFPKSLFLFLLVVVFITMIRIVKDDYHTAYSSNTKSIVGTVIKIEGTDSLKTISLKNKEVVLVKTTDKIHYRLGQKIRVFGKMEKPNRTAVFHLFQYDQYLKSKHIYWIMKAEKIEIVSRKQRWYDKLREQVIRHIDQYQSKEYLHAFILGDSSKIDDNIKKQFQVLGISHLFAISGMHVGLLSMLLSKLLSKCCSKRIVSIFLTIFFIFYIFLTGATPSVIRAVSMTIIFLWTNRYHRLHLLLLLGAVLLLYNPFYCYHLGFIFSFTISFFLLRFQHMLNMKKGYVRALLCTSSIAFLASFPILISNFYEINILTIVYNLLFVPFVSYLLFPLSLLTFCVPVFDSIFVFVITVFQNLLSIMAKFSVHITFCYVPVYFLILYYIVIYYTLSKWSKRKGIGLVLIILVLSIHQIMPYWKEAKVTVLDVGQGDCILIQLEHNQGAVLIDTGGMNSFSSQKKFFLAENRIIPYLKSQGIRKLDAAILTHGDYDHMGEAIELVNHFPVDKVVLNIGNDNELESELLKKLKEKNISYYHGLQTLTIHHHKFYFLNTKEYDNENDNSNIVYFKYRDYQFLFMGDASSEREQELLQHYHLEHIDVLKVGHHGSKTSSSLHFINRTQPKYTVISVGKNNRYGHPNKEVLHNLRESKIYRTDRDGSVRFKMYKHQLKIETFAR